MNSDISLQATSIGAIGAFVVVAAPFVGMLPIGPEAYPLRLVLAASGYILWSIGCFRVRHTTGPYAIATVVFACIAAFACVLILARVGRPALVVRDLALLLVAVWGFTSARAVGLPIGFAAGFSGVLAGMGELGRHVRAEHEWPAPPVSELAHVIDIAAIYLGLASWLLLGVAMLRLRRMARRASPSSEGVR